jgi:trimeric autotransporter adhesin
MNHIYRLCWNRSLSQWVPASELAHTPRAGGGSRKRGVIGQCGLVLSLLAVSLGMTGLAHAGTSPMGGQIVSGAGQVQQVGNVTTIKQDSSTLMLNWQSFDVGANQTVDFLQPGSGSIAVNRIFSNTPSEIDGHLNANGQVWLINPNGVLFGQGSQVNVGGLVASTLDVDDSTLGTGTLSFSGSGKGSIVNRGTLTAANGGYIALLGNQVSNQGTITAQLGTVALAGGSAVTLTFTGNQLVHLQVNQSTLNNLAENRQLIVADGGQVIMTAGAKEALLASVVNNTGVVQAQTVQNHNGTITLLGGMSAGTVNVGGTLDASAPNGGSGGSIETSAANFNLASDAHITAAAPQGKAGTWLVDPTDLTIDSAAATTISNTLNGGTSVTEQTTSTGATGVGTQTSGSSDPGDIIVNAGTTAISWSNAAATLTLQAYNGINVESPISGAGKVVMIASGTSGGGITIASGGSILGGAGVTLASATNFVNNAGSAAVSTGTTAPWLIYSTNPTQDTDGGLTPNFIQYNAPYPTTAVISGNGFLYSVAPTLTVTGLTGSVTKSYDGTTSAPLSASNLTDSGLINGDTIASATGTYASSNAGSNIAVTSPSAIGGFSIVNAAGVPVYGYALSGSASANIGTINPAVLTATIIGDPTKTYDGTTTATLNSSNYQITGFAAGQGATVNQPSSVAYAGSDAGSQQVNATFSITNFVANSGTSLSNYVLPTTASGMGTINQASVLLSGVLANNKTYDGTTADTLNLSNASIYGVISGDNVTLDTTGATGTFASANAGNDIAVALSGFTLTGAKADDYKLVAPTNLTADIAQKALTISGITANDKVYDGTTADTLNTGTATLVGVVGGDTVGLQTGSATGSFSQSDVGSNLAVTASGLTLSGAQASNYTLVDPTGLTANITPRPLTVSFNGSPAKIYDGTDAATLTQGDFTITGFAGSEGAVVSQSPAIYGGVNAGTNIGVTATLQPSDFTVDAGTKLSNYTFNSTVTGLGTIDPAPLVVSIVNNPTKSYDGNTNATLGAGNYTLSGLIGSDSISLTNTPTTGTYASPNAGIEGVTSTLSSSNYSAGGSTLLSNYVLPTLASGYGTIVPAAVGVTIVASLNQPVTKVYDGTDTYLLNATSGSGTTYTQEFNLTGFQGTDAAYVNANITGYFASKNVGSNQPFQVTLNASDFTFTSGSASNYTFPTYVFTTGSITPAPLTISLVGNLTKVYDGTTVAQLNSSNFQVSGFVSGEGATLTPTASFNYATANAGSNITISGSLTANNYTANSGTLLSNYTLAYSASGLGTITQAPLFVTGVYATNKVYDTTANDTLNIGSVGLSGLVASDVGNVTLASSTSGTFAQSNVGTGIAVTANGFSISGSAASNYSLQPITGLTANITPATLTISGVTASNKVYDGTTADVLNAGSATLQGVFSGDTVNLNGGSAAGTFITSNVGNNLAVSAAGFTLTGAQAGNYVLDQPAGLTANITPATLTAVITGSPTKVYDGTNSATLTASDYTLTGFVNGQGASIPQSATANYTTPNAGTGLGVQSTLVVSDFVANAGTLLSNYILPTSASGNNGVITPYVLNLSGTRVYDAGTDAMGNLFGTVTGLNGDLFTLSGQGSTSSKNIGTYTGTGATSGSQPFNIGSLALVGAGSSGSGTDIASNYTLVGGADTFVITPLVLTVTGTTVNTKTYDGTTTATLGGTQQLQGVLSGDSVTISTDVGNFASPNAGTNIPVSSAITLGGTDAGNYILTQPTGLTGTITQAVINLVGTREYNAGTNAASSAFGTNGTISTGVGGQTLTVTGTGTVSNADVNTYTQSGGTFNLGTLALGNGSGLASNYTLGSNGTFTITPDVINLSGTRVYDTTTDADASLFGNSGVITGVGGQTLTLSGTGGVSSKNVGTYTGTGSTSGSQGFNLDTLQLSDGSGSATNYTLIGGTDTLTITKAPLSITGTTVDPKTYDGTTTATLGGNQQLVGVLGSDNVTINADVGNFATPNAGTNIPVSSAITLTGSDAGNYTLTQPTGLTGTINQAVINLSGTREYDAGTTASSSTFGSNGTISTGIGSQTLTVTGTGSVSSANVNTYTQSGGTFNLGTLALGNGTGLASNYTFGTSSTFTITPYVLDLSGTRVYDTTTNADASVFGNGGVISGVGTETLTLSGVGGVSSKNVGTYTGTGATSGSQPFNLDTLQLSDGTGSASNYTLIGGTDTLVITKAPLSITGTTVNTKTYDDTTTATLGGNQQLVGVLGSDNVTINADVGNFATANAGTNISVSSAITLSGSDASNYTLTQPTGLTGTINQAVINLSGTREYDGQVDANAGAFGSNGTINTGVAGQTLTLSGAGTVAQADVNTYTGGNFNTGTLALNNGTGLASNYTLAGGTDTFAITPYVINLSGTRQYDGTADASASLFGNNGTINTGIGSQTLTLTGLGTVSSANASTNPYTGVGATTGTQGFNLNTLQLNDGTGQASNYTLIGGTDSLTINKATINLSGTRQYDGGTDANASVFGNSGTINTGVNGETVTLTGSGTVTSANVGNDSGTNFGIGTLALSGASASNYTLTGGSDSLAITPYVISLTGSRDYNGTTDADGSLFGNNGVITGLLGQTLTLSGSGTVSSANASTTPYTGTGASSGSQGFNLNTLTLTGNGSTLAGNYTLIGGTDSLTINKAVINLSGTREYDGGVDANASTFGSNGTITGVNGETLTLTGAGTVTSADVGNYTGGNFNTGTLALNSGTGSASNYTLTGGTDNMAITPYVLNLTGTRVYNGTTGANASLFGSNGVLTGVNGETLTLGGSGVLSTKNVGQQLAFASNGLNGFTLTGNGSALGTNYTLTGGTDWVTITPLAITVSATGQNKTYDGTTTAGVTLGSNGVLAGDTVNFGDGAANFSSPNAGSNVSIAVTGITASGADAGDYIFNTTATTSATITPYVLNLTGTRVYDGTTGANASLFGNNGVLTGINGETVTLSGSGVLTSKNVGTQLAFANIGSLALGNGSGLAGNYTLVGGTDWVSITPLPIVVTATGTNRLYNGQDGDTVSLGSNGVLPGDVLSFTDTSANFGTPYVGNGKTVTVTGITASGTDAGDYLITDPTTTTTADITSAGFSGSGVQGSWIAQLQAGLQSMPIATPYGSADMDVVGVYTGNQQLRHQPIERNRARVDFHSGLALQMENDGVRLPADALP